MITLVIGGPGSGKSELAESIAAKSGHKNMYYIATMQVVDDESALRRKKHQAAREGKGFITLEIPVLIDAAPDLMSDPASSVALLECMANFVGNLMHEPEWARRLTSADSETGDEFVRLVIRRVMDLASHVGHLVVVSERFNSDESFDDDTVLYKDLLDAVNARLCRISDRVHEL